MKKVLPNIFCPTVLFYLLLATTPGYAHKNTTTPDHKPTDLSFFRFFPLKKISSTTAALTITAPANLQLNTDPWLNVATNVLLGTPLVLADNADYSVSNNAPVNFPIGVTNIAWTVIDDKGNVATAIQTVTVTDNEKPYIFRMFEISVVNDPGQCGAVVNLMVPETYDNSGGPVTITSNAPAYFPVGSVLITWTATDIYGNSDTSTQMITVIDNELPTISTNDITVNNTAGQCGAVVNLGTPVTSDNCGVLGVSNDAPSLFPVGTTLVHWVVTDHTGYTNETIQTVIVKDTEKPVIMPPASITVNNATGKCGATVALTAPVVTDNCGVASLVNNAPAQFATGTTLVTWTATDNNGNTATALQTIMVKDVEAPVFSDVPANVTVTCGGIPSVTNPLATDNCTVMPVISFSQVSTQLIDVTKPGYYNYTITRTWIAKDAANNSRTATQVITVQDKTAPVITLPLNISVNNSLNLCGATVNFTATASDNCGSPVTLAYSKSSGSLFSTGITTVTVTAKDASGNSSSKTFTVTVKDTQKPTIAAPSNITVTANNNTANNVNLGTPVTGDNCGVKSIKNNAPIAYSVGTTTVIWTVTDVNNNVSTATQTVTVNSIKRKSNEAVPAAIRAATEGTIGVDVIKISVAPNPSRSYFTLKLESNADLPMALRVTDATGRIVDTRQGLTANTTIQVGHNYATGCYFAEIQQGTQRKVVQLVKVN